VGFINLCGVKMRLFAIILLAGQLFGSTPQDRVAELLQQAAHETMIGPHWARLMIEADGEAEKMEQPSTFGGMYRSVRIADHPLTFLSNEISGVEDYQHDLLKLVVAQKGGTPDGALALNSLLTGPGSCGRLGNEFTPYFKTVLDIVASPEWVKLHDAGLTRIRAEAYETWWSMWLESGAEEFKPGAADALKQAILAYRELVRLNRGVGDAHDHLKNLEAGLDTHQHNWFCEGD
jgi:hypothetical protein